MKILVINCGSSSLKYQLIDMASEKVMAKGTFERIGQPNSFLTHKVNGEKYRLEKPVQNHNQNHRYQRYHQNGVSIHRHVFDEAKRYQKIIFIHIDGLVCLSHNL